MTSTIMFGSLFSRLFNLYTVNIARKFGSIGKNCSIRPILNCNLPKNVFLGNNVNIGMFCWIDTNQSINKKPKLIIDDNVSIGAHSMVIAANKIKIGKNVLMSERITILDHIHDYQDIKKPIIRQPLVLKGKVIIKEDCFIGINSAILGNVKIGKHSVVGANSVVTHDVPSYCVVAGAPAKIIKRYDFKKKKWIKVKNAKS